MWERAILGEKEQGNVQGFCVVCLTVFFGYVHRVHHVLLKYEAYLGGNTEVGGRDEHNFLQHRVFGKFVRVLDFRVEFLLSHHIQMHHVANIQIEDPVLRVLNSQSIPYIQFKSLVAL